MTRNNSDNCIFCKIGAHTMDAGIVFENDQYMAFKDIHPKANTHVLVIPKEHINDLKDAENHQDAFHGLWDAVIETAKKLGVVQNAKLQVHSGQNAGQEVMHLHVHILSDAITED